MDYSQIGNHGELQYPGMEMDEKLDEVLDDYESRAERDSEIMEKVTERKSSADMIPSSFETKILNDDVDSRPSITEYIDNPDNYNEKQFVTTSGFSDQNPHVTTSGFSDQNPKKIIATIRSQPVFSDNSEEYDSADEYARSFSGSYRDQYQSQMEDEPEYPSDADEEDEYYETEEIDDVNEESVDVLKKPELMPKTDITKIQNYGTKYIRNISSYNSETTLSGHDIIPREQSFIDGVNELLEKDDWESKAMFEMRYNFTQWILENPKIDLRLGDYFDEQTVISYGRLFLNKFWKGVKYNAEVEKKLSAILKVCPEIDDYINPKSE